MNNKKHISAENFFHKKPDNLNCAQSILKAYQEEFSISESEIEAFKAYGGGKVEGGICGALFAAEKLIEKKGLKYISEEFENRVGSVLCKCIKARKYPCSYCVQIADELVYEQLIKNR